MSICACWTTRPSKPLTLLKCAAALLMAAPMARPQEAPAPSDYAAPSDRALEYMEERTAPGPMPQMLPRPEPANPPAAEPKPAAPPRRALASLEQPEPYIAPEKTTAVRLSNRDVNRINCPGPVQDVFWSKEKPVEVTPEGANVFVKFLVRREGERETPATMPVDLHIVCGGQVYTLIVHPVDMDSATLRLGLEPQRRAAAVAQEWGALPLEERIRRFTLAVYRDELPAGFRRSALNHDGQWSRTWHDLLVRGVQRVTAPGLGLAALEFEITPSRPMTLDERDFLKMDVSPDIVAITLDPPVIEKAGGKTRLIVIERSVGHGRE